jgi:hypothetical protein
VALTIAFELLLPPMAVAQTAISAQAGMINYIEGRVLLKDEPVFDHPGRFLHIEARQHLRTEKGRAEILFAVGTFLRIAENSEIEIVTAGLTSARVKLHRGSMIVDSQMVFDEDSLTVSIGEAEAQILKKGLYRFDVNKGGEGSLEIMNGEVLLVSGGAEHQIKKKRSAVFGGPGAGVSITPFKRWSEDELTEWSAKRADVVAQTIAPGLKRKGRDDRRIFSEQLPNRRRAGLPNP